MDFPRVIVGLGIVAVGAGTVLVSGAFAAVVSLAGLYVLGTGIKE